ncbi:MAG TPA: protein kinase [Thermoanaerobaculia bacterium]|nr:protein kinase [Thermoanaerobaculia bacterium]
MSPKATLDPARWQRIEALLDLLLELPAEVRGQHLAAACGQDVELQAQVEALLAADAEAEGARFLGSPAALGEDAPREVGPYQLVRLIGEGGMGRVYEAWDRRLGRQVALKFLPREVARDAAARERFLREARAASALDHPNILTVHDLGETEDGEIYLVTAFYEGETLRDRLERGPLAVEEARTVALQVARALRHAHGAGVLHRDIKPANVMLPREGEAKVLDFGLAKVAGETAMTRTGTSPGTPAYMSPEQVRGEPLDERTDLFSLAATLYEMLAGRRAFSPEAEGVHTMMHALLSQDPEPIEKLRPEVPPELARVVTKALAKRPADRHSSAAELLVELARDAPARGVRAAPPAGGRRWSARKGALLAGALAAVLVAVGLVVWSSRPASGPPLRVAILSPEVTVAGGGAELALVPADTVDATLSALTALSGVQPLDPPRRDETRGSEVERRRAAEADEVLLPLLDCGGDWCRVTLRRLERPNGAVLATAGPFEVQSGIENVLRLAEAVRVHTRGLYPDHRPRPGSPGDRVRPQDHAAYVELARRVDRGERLGHAELARLDALLLTSPDLLGAWRLAADVARLAGALDRAFDYAAGAHRLDAHDPGPLFTRFRIEMAANQLGAARETLAQLSQVAPGDTRVASAEADLFEAQGELERARTLREEVARRRPSWPQALELVTLELRLGATESALRRLRNLLSSHPDNQYVRENLAWLEASYGNLARAEALYEELTRVQATRPHLTNLGWVHFLRQDYAGAESSYRQALALEPEHLLTRVNLAAALAAQGEAAGARALFTSLATELAAAPAPLATRTRLLHAQCLARLGRRAEAARLAEETLRQAPEDVHGLHQAAQVQALLGERLAALYYTERALKKGLAREWFEIPELASLQQDPDFRALLAAREEPPP